MIRGRGGSLAAQGRFTPARPCINRPGPRPPPASPATGGPGQSRKAGEKKGGIGCCTAGPSVAGIRLSAICTAGTASERCAVATIGLTGAGTQSAKARRVPPPARTAPLPVRAGPAAAADRRRRAAAASTTASVSGVTWWMASSPGRRRAQLVFGRIFIAGPCPFVAPWRAASGSAFGGAPSLRPVCSSKAAARAG